MEANEQGVGQVFSQRIQSTEAAPLAIDSVADGQTCSAAENGIIDSRRSVLFLMKDGWPLPAFRPTGSSHECVCSKVHYCNADE
jgi:hypothetical protein